MYVCNNGMSAMQKNCTDLNHFYVDRADHKYDYYDDAMPLIPLMDFPSWKPGAWFRKKKISESYQMSI